MDGPMAHECPNLPRLLPTTDYAYPPGLSTVPVGEDDSDDDDSSDPDGFDATNRHCVGIMEDQHGNRIAGPRTEISKSFSDDGGASGEEAVATGGSGPRRARDPRRRTSSHVRSCTPKSRRGLCLTLVFMLTVVTPPVEGISFASEPVLGMCMSAIGTWLTQASGVAFVLASLFLIRSKLVSTPLDAVPTTSHNDMKEWINKWTTACDYIAEERRCSQTTIGVNCRPDDGSAPRHRTPSNVHLPTATFYVCAQCDTRFRQFWDWAAICPNCDCDHGSHSCVNGVTEISVRPHITIQQEQRVQTECLHRPRDAVLMAVSDNFVPGVATGTLSYASRWLRTAKDDAYARYEDAAHAYGETPLDCPDYSRDRHEELLDRSMPHIYGGGHWGSN
jgi:hypothetical protein